MSSTDDREAAKGGFNNPFGGDEPVGQVSTDTNDSVNLQRMRSTAEDTAAEEKVAPRDQPTTASPSLGHMEHSSTPAPSGPKEATSTQHGVDAKDVHHLDEIETLPTNSLSSSSSDQPDADHHHGMAVEKIRRTATKVADKFHLSHVQVGGPSSFFNPTNVRAKVRWATGHDEPGMEAERTGTDYDLLWRSRDNRKGRGSIAVRGSLLEHPQRSAASQRIKQQMKHIGSNVKRMFTTFPYWDMAFWSGWSYTIGSALFVLDGAFAWSPAAFPDSEFNDEDTYGVPLCFFFGALFFQIGAVVAYLEAVNDGSFHGSAMRRLMEGHEDDQRRMLDEKIHAFFGSLKPHHHKDEAEDEAEKVTGDVDPEAGWKTKDRNERPGSVYPPAKHPGRRRGGVDMGEAEEGQSSTYLTWRWWASWHALRTHHVYEIGYVACAIQLFGVTLYGVTSIIVLPGILDSFEPWQELGGYWIPQMVAAACFLIASIMFTFETQEKWWKPEVRVLGWWIGFWSIVGSVGFELCAAFGPASGTQHWALYQSNLSSMWGSMGYLTGSILQWYEAINKHPVEEMFNERGDLKSWQVHPV